MTTCVVCRSAETEPGHTTVTFHRDGHTVVINEVPALVCPNCGEAYVAEAESAQVLSMAKDAFAAGVAVLVRDFQSAAA